MATIWRRACMDCTKSKRQCTKAVPACRRCVDKGIPCVYPPARRIVHAETAESASPRQVTHRAGGSNDAGAGDLNFPPLQLTPADLGGGIGGQPLLTDSPQPSLDDTASTASGDTWFLTPESWIADYTLPPNQPTAVQDMMLQRFIDGVQSWLKRWTVEGSSPLHHRHLYREKMPRYVQDAYTAVTMYHTSAARDSSANAEARATALRVFDDRVVQLLQDQALETSLGKQMDIFDHLSRVQALLTYQTIRLFDGDVRMRAQAEDLVPTLFLWTKQLLDSAKENLTRPSRFLADIANSASNYSSCFGYGPGSTSSSGSGAGCSEDTVWRAWILVESVRRTWLVSNYLQEIYLYMKRGWGNCPGRMTITMRGGLWDAASSYAWSRKCREQDALFLPTTGTEKLFYERCPEDIDEFSLFIVELSYGVDRIERWLGESKGRREGASLLEGWDGEPVFEEMAT
ncbi:hypothetical protein F5Y13DRAFT_100643 [Hypoxylon sp. FL1857]|nr:hypothetical protein F5Y13DRAFT_100643 [Hypoxylon sp. FL1857]